MIEDKNAIEIRNLYKSFKVSYDKPTTLKEQLISIGKRSKVERRLILEDISLDIKEGETVALIGTNGSGKSTLLKLMTKILYPTQGDLKTYGKLTSLLELGAGFHPDFTGRENIYFNASIFGLTRPEIEKRIDSIIAFSELGEYIDNPIRTYSSGMYMRLAFSIAINVDAEILLIDEILAVGDQHFQSKCFRKLKELKKSEKTIVIVSHSLDVVKDLCTRAIWIYKGKMKLDGDPNYVINEYLKQIAIDNKEERKRSIESGEAKFKGVLFVDTPSGFTHLEKGNGMLTINGWCLSDHEQPELQIYVDDLRISDYTAVSRPDVVEAYKEDFAGLLEHDKVGFSCSYPLSELASGDHRVRIVLWDCKRDEEVTDKDVIFYLD